eukprot:128459-Chlamydomonas_euryale.AAC.1
MLFAGGKRQHDDDAVQMELERALPAKLNGLINACCSMLLCATAQARRQWRSSCSRSRASSS